MGILNIFETKVLLEISNRYQIKELLQLLSLGDFLDGVYDKWWRREVEIL